MLGEAANGYRVNNHSNQGIFLLGLGAQKAGTSWLHQQLNQRDDVDFGFLKEYHVHDIRHVPDLMKPGHQQRRLPGPRTLRRRAFISDPQRYYNYFRRLLKQPGILLTGDITPSYGALPASALLEIRDNFSNRYIQVKPVFVMRDPIERLISKQRMKLRKQKIDDPRLELAALRKLAESRPRGASLRGDYGRTLRNLNESFGLQSCFIGLYETQFQAPNHQQLCDFLSIPYTEPDWHQTVNQSRTSTIIPEDILAALGQWQASSFAAVEHWLPDIDIATLWPTANRWCRS
jgi:hypothetical protein